MARRPRLDPHGGIHHVMNQGWNKLAIFIDDEDRKTFVRFLRQACNDSECELIAFCLMGNHFHLVVHCPKAGLPLLMQRLCGHYAHYFNRRHRRKGAVFAGRYQSVLIQDDPQLLVTTRYVDRNPLELGYDIRTYPWSSHCAYLGRGFAFVHTELVLSIIGGPAAYRHFVETPLPSDRFSMSDGNRKWNPHVLDDELSAIRRAVRGTSRALDDRSEGSAIALIAMERGRLTATEVAAQLGLGSGSTVRSMARRARLRTERDDDFARIVTEADQMLRAA